MVAPEIETALASTLKPVHLRCAWHVNWTHNLTGGLLQGRYFSCPLDDNHCLTAIRHVECNPVRAGLVDQAEDYPWSSAASHTGRCSDPMLSERLKVETGIQDWSAWLAEKQPDQAVEQLRRLTRGGCPLGDEASPTSWSL